MSPVRLSARALGVLGAMVRDRTLTSAKRLSEAVLEGQAAILKAMKELEQHGFIERGTNRIGGRILAFTRVSEAGLAFYYNTLPQRDFRATVIEADIRTRQPYNLYTDKTSTSVLLVKIPGQSPGEEDEVPYEFYKSTSDNSSDEVEARLRWQREQKEEAAQKKSKPRIPRQQLPPQAWSCSDVADYFIDLLSQRWGISHFTIVKSRFIPALAEKRKAFNTDGAIECRMIDLFFESIDHDKYTNGTYLWSSFIKHYPNYEQLARASMVTPEEEMQDQLVADKSWSWIEEEGA